MRTLFSGSISRSAFLILISSMSLIGCAPRSAFDSEALKSFSQKVSECEGEEVNIAPFVCGEESVLICHVPPGNPLARHTLCVGVAGAINGHQVTVESLDSASEFRGKKCGLSHEELIDGLKESPSSGHSQDHLGPCAGDGGGGEGPGDDTGGDGGGEGPGGEEPPPPPVIGV